MISDDYFKSMSGDLFDYSIIRNINGQGILYCDSPLPVEWAVSVDISGNKFLIIKTDLISGFGNFLMSSVDDKKYRLEGKSYNEQWSLTCIDLVINSSSFSLDNNLVTFVCSFNQVIIQKNFENINSVRAFISNFHFKGLEITKTGDKYFKDRFTVNIQKRKIEFKLLENSSEIKSLIESGRIHSAIMSELTLATYNDETIEDISNLISNISLFLSTLTLNHNFAHVIEYESRGEVVMIEIANRITSKYHGNILIDNHRIRSGIKQIFESSFLTYIELKGKLDLVRFTHLIVEIYQQRFIELKMATLIIAYEQLLTKYLIFNEVEVERLENIQQKLGALNRIMRFIPKELQNDKLRDQVRNPLFHTGNIPFLSSEEIRSIYFKYQDLLMRIYLRILKYQGNYISRLDHNTSKPV